LLPNLLVTGDVDAVVFRRYIVIISERSFASPERVVVPMLEESASTWRPIPMEATIAQMLKDEFKYGGYVVFFKDEFYAAENADGGVGLFSRCIPLRCSA
jgi:hypothetical protein